MTIRFIAIALQKKDDFRIKASYSEDKDAKQKLEKMAVEILAAIKEVSRESLM
jgi:hypothetical protein